MFFFRIRVFNQLLEKVNELIVVEEGFGEVLSNDFKNTERFSSYYFLGVVDELIEMGENFHKASLDIGLVRVLTKTTEKQGTRFPVSPFRTVDNLSYSICNFLYQINPTTANKGR